MDHRRLPFACLQETERAPAEVEPERSRRSDPSPPATAVTACRARHETSHAANSASGTMSSMRGSPAQLNDTVGARLPSRRRPCVTSAVEQREQHDLRSEGSPVTQGRRQQEDRAQTAKQVGAEIGERATRNRRAVLRQAGSHAGEVGDVGSARGGNGMPSLQCASSRGCRAFYASPRCPPTKDAP